MSNKYQVEIDAFMEKVKASNGHETEFLQAVLEVAEAVIPFMEVIRKIPGPKIIGTHGRTRAHHHVSCSLD